MHRSNRTARLIGALLAALALSLVGPGVTGAVAQPSAAQLPPLPPILPDPPERPEPPAPAPPPAGPMLHLTFDDGPDPRWTPQILDVLARHGARATFFIVGKRADAYPELVRRVLAEGHTIANHTYTHVDLTTVSAERFRTEVGHTQRALGRDGRMCLRPPYGAVDQTVRDRAAALGYRLQLWTVDTRDYTRPGAEVIADRIVDGARDGAVILLHDAGGTDRSQTVQGLSLALDRLESGAWRYQHTC